MRRENEAADMPAISIVLLVILLNVTAYRGSKLALTLFAIDLGASQISIGVLIAMYSVAPVLLGLYAGKLTDRLGARTPMIAGTLGVFVALVVPFIFPGLPALYATSALIGASWVFYNICAQNLIGILSSPESRARNFSNFGLVMAGGSFFGPQLSGFSIDHFGFERTYLHLSIVPLVASFVLLAWRSMPAGGGSHTPTEEEQATYSANLLSNKPLRRTLLTSAIILTGTDLFQFYMPIYGHSIGMSASAIGMILAMFSVAAFVVRLVMPALVKRWTADAVLVCALFVGGGAYLLFPLVEQGVLLAGVAFILGLGMGCSQPLSLMLIYDRAPPGRSGEALGLRLTINNFMHIAVPMIFGSLGSAFGVAPVFFTNAAFLTAGGILTRRR
jgi:MFS family permease